jgi:hypothetical protein
MRVGEVGHSRPSWVRCRRAEEVPVTVGVPQIAEDSAAMPQSAAAGHKETWQTDHQVRGPTAPNATRSKSIPDVLSPYEKPSSF